MLTKEENSLINNYLDNNLSKDEMKKFKERFDSNPAFAREVKQYTDVGIALKSISKYRKQSKPKSKKIPFRIYSIAIAASIVVLVAIYLNFPPGLTYEQEIAQNYIENSNNSKPQKLVRSSTSQVDKLTLNKFPEAINFMEEGKFEEAIIILEMLYELNDNIIFDEVSWYLALAYLRTGKKDEANKIFIDLINSNSIYSNKSFEIFNKLDSINLITNKKNAK